MKKILETSKGRFLIVQAIDNASVHTGIKLSEITEKQASEIVDLFSLQYNKYKRVYSLYNLENINHNINHTFSSIQSLHSLLESQGIEITNNTYIFKV